MLEFRRCWKISWILQQLFPSLKLSIFSPCSSIDLNGIKTLQSKQFKTEETVYSKSYLSSSLSLSPFFFSLSLCVCGHHPSWEMPITGRVELSESITHTHTHTNTHTYINTHIHIHFFVYNIIPSSVWIEGVSFLKQRKYFSMICFLSHRIK